MTSGPTYSSEWLKLEKSFGGRLACHGSALEIREFAATMQAQQPKIEDPMIERIDRLVDGRKVRIHRRKGITTQLAVCLYFHSGGFIMGDLDTEAEFCDWLAHSCLVVQGEYRLAPENPHPAAFEDAMLLWNWTHQSIAIFGGDKDRILVAGAASGGTIALSLTNSLIEQHVKTSAAPFEDIRACIVLAPITLHPENIPEGCIHSSYKDNVNAWMVDGESMKVFLDAAQSDQTDPRQFPALNRQHLGYFPPTHIVVCGGDVLRDDGVIMGDVLRRAGCDVTVEMYADMPHFFWVFPVRESAHFKHSLRKQIEKYCTVNGD